MSDLPAYMHAEIPDTVAGISADAAGGWIIVTKCGGEVLRFTAQQWENFLRLGDRARCIVETGIGDMQ